MKKLQVIRTHLSPYQAPDFGLLEGKMVSALGMTYASLKHVDESKEIVLLTNTHTQLTELPSQILKHTVLIIHPNSGYDHFESEGAIWKDIPLIVGHEIRAQGVAEYSLNALFQGLAELPQHLAWDQKRSWDRSLIGGQNIWVFGYGHIGKLVSDVLRVLGAKVTVVDPFVSGHMKNWKDGELKEARAVIACCSLNKTSHHLFNREFFESASPELLFINGARGKLVDEVALREFLQKNPRAFAFLDVFEREPFGHEWHHHPQVWKTSHIAGVTKDLDERILNFEQKVLRDFSELPRENFLAKYSHELLQNKWHQGTLI